MVVPHLSNVFWAEVAAGAADAAARQRVRLVVSTDGGVDGRRERELVELHRSLGVDGLLLASFQPRRAVAGYGTGGVPIVLVGRQGREVGIPSISVDETAGVDAAVAHLVTLGHRRIAFANGDPKMSWCAERRSGWRRAVRHHGLDPDGCPELNVDDVMLGGGEGALASVLALDRRPTAVLCANDYLAVGLLQACRGRGVRVPQDLSIVGFDDILLASVCEPPLTTVRQDAAALGRGALEMLVSPAAERSNRLVAPSLSVRGSSSVPPAERSAGRPRLTGDEPTRSGDEAQATLVVIRSAALELLDETGIEAVTYRAIARRVGLSLGTVSYHLRPFGDLRHHLWQQVEVDLAGTAVAGVDLDDAVDRIVGWISDHRERAMFYASHTPDPSRPLRLDLLAAVPQAPRDPDDLERHRAFLRLIGRRLQTVVEYVLLEPDDRAARQVLAAELRAHTRLWAQLIERVTSPTD